MLSDFFVIFRLQARGTSNRLRHRLGHHLAQLGVFSNLKVQAINGTCLHDLLTIQVVAAVEFCNGFVKGGESFRLGCGPHEFFIEVRQMGKVLHERWTDKHISAHNADLKPFIWTASASDILEKVKRGRPAAPVPKEHQIKVTAEFTHKIWPIQRGERYEEPLSEALMSHGYGGTDGGGTMQSNEGEIPFIDVHMFPSSPDTSIPFGIREGFAIYLDGVNLPAEVCKQCDSNVVVSEIDKRLKGHREIESHWQGRIETAIYDYGDSNSVMKPHIAEFMASYPLWKGARIVDLTP